MQFDYLTLLTANWQVFSLFFAKSSGKDCRDTAIPVRACVYNNGNKWSILHRAYANYVTELSPYRRNL